MSKDRRLGRGLAALLGTPLEEELLRSEGGAGAGVTRDMAHNATPHAERDTASDHAPPQAAGPAEGGLIYLDIHEIDDNPFQPRRDFSEPEIVSLSESLKEHDMLQPVLVRRVGDRYQLISGERRLRAAIRAGWTRIPARAREADDRLVAELAIVENLQRKDLNAIEKALSFKRYIEQHRCTQDDLARRLKLDRSTIANLMRLLELPERVLEDLRTGKITAGHARGLLPLGDEAEQIAFSERIQREGMSVREVERLVQERIEQEDGPRLAVVSANGNRRRPRAPRSEQVASLEQELRIALGTKVDIRQTSRGKGRIVIHFAGHDEFERLRELMTNDGSHGQRSHVG